MVVIEELISLIFIASLILISNEVRADPPYSEIHQTGINYIIATVGIEELRLTECAYVLKKFHIELFDRKRIIILSKFTKADKLEVEQTIAKLRPDLKSFLDEAIKKFKTNVDTKTACGMVAGEALRKLGEAQENLNIVANVN